MARLRLVPVVYNICSRDGCATRFEGRQCPNPDCNQAPDRTTLRQAYERFIVVAIDPPPYERRQFCKCPVCDNLYELSEEELRLVITCCTLDAAGRQCPTVLFPQGHIDQIKAGLGLQRIDPRGLLKIVLRLRAERETLLNRPAGGCGHAITLSSLCPRAGIAGALHADDASSGLPKGLTAAWKRRW